MVKRITAWKKDHPDGKLAVFGHADAVGKEDPNKNLGADGVADYACPVCGTFDKAIGCISLKDWANKFFLEDVKVLKHGPKTLLFSNCCLTAIIDAYAKYRPRIYEK